MKFKNKEEIRNYIWGLLKNKGICLFPCENHIPNFKGVEKTIERILELEEYKKANRVFISPDTPQRPLVYFAKKDNKEVYVASPKLKYGFIKIIEVPKSKDIRIKDLFSFGKILGFNIPKVDLAIIGSVAVDLKGNRIGKGLGLGDKEIKILRSRNENLKVVTNVHDLQVFEDFSYLMNENDEKIDIIVTPSRIIKIT